MTCTDAILAYLKAAPDAAFLRREFLPFGSQRQVSRSLRELQSRWVLVRVGQGIYARSRKSNLSDRAVPEAALETIGLQALRKLGIQAGIGSDQRALMERRSTQVPMLPVIEVGNARIRRKIGLGVRVIVYERNGVLDGG